MENVVASLIYGIYEMLINSGEQFERLLQAPEFSIIFGQCLEEIKDLSKEVWERICYFQEEYEKLLGIKRTFRLRRHDWESY